MMAATLALLTTTYAVAPMPQSLPSYKVICRGGELTGRKRKMIVTISGQSESRWAEIVENGTSFKAPVQTVQIALLEAVGGDGFVDKIDQRVDGKFSITMLAIRGKIDDDLISFNVVGPRSVHGSCHLVDLQSGTIQ